MIDLEDDLRRFAIDVYQVDGVSSASVLLQDRGGVDVNVLLLATFVGAVRGKSFTSREIGSARARTEPWQCEVVRPLRSLRRRLRDGPPPAPTADTVALRKRIEAAELEAEMIELTQLANVLARLDTVQAPGDAVERATSAMRAVVRDFAGREPEHDELDAIATIAVAAARFVGV